MKKLFLACVLSLLTTSTFAQGFTLKGIITDKTDQTGLEGVQITFDGKKKRESIGKGIFTIPNIDMTDGKSREISFSKAEYDDLVGTLEITPFFIPNSSEPIYLVSFNGKNIKPDKDWNYVFEMTLTPVPIIRGKITIENKDEKFVFEKDIEIKVSGFANGETRHFTQKCEGEVDCEYEILGYLGAADNSRKYDLSFHYGDENDKTYEDIELPVEVGEKVEDVDVRFEKMTLAKKQQENMEKITGFGCNDTMPRYLVGANCVENSTLEGNATDLPCEITK